MIAFFAAAVAILFSQSFPGLADRAAGPIFMGTILVLGMPHGTTDAVLLFSKKHAARWLGISSRTLWIVGYLGIALAYAVLWNFLPVISMLLFLGLTVLHWGTSEYSREGRSDWSWLGLGLTRGLLVVLGVLTLQPAGSVAAIELVAGDHVSLPLPLLRWVLTTVVMLHFVLLFFDFRESGESFERRAFDSLLILLLLAFTPAFLGMAIYYSFFHAERYYRFFQDDSLPLFGFTHLLCFFFVSGAALSFANFELFALASMTVHFQVLAALTLPHTLLVWYLQERRAESAVTSTQLATV